MPDTRNRVESVFIAGKSPLTKPRLDNKRQKGEHNKPRRRRRRRKKKKKKKRRTDPKSLLIVAPTSFSEGDGGGIEEEGKGWSLSRDIPGNYNHLASHCNLELINQLLLSG